MFTQTQRASDNKHVIRFTVGTPFVDIFVSSAVFNKILIDQNPLEIFIGYQNPMIIPSKHWPTQLSYTPQ
jgi:hypothetical protein